MFSRVFLPLLGFGLVMAATWMIQGDWYIYLNRFKSAPIAERRVNSGENNRKIILAWNSFYKAPYFGAGGSGTRPFANCSVGNCLLTNDRRNVSEASAILFHVRQLRDLPRQRNSTQLYVFFLRESPRYTRWNRHQQRYNLTMTYRRDSDIPIPVGEVVRKTTTDSGYETKIPFANRTRGVAWVVSHCKTASEREKYVRKLQQYIDVDIYGKCWKTKSPVCKTVDRSCVFETIPAHYKFYLGFENSLCKDYVTEKLFRPLSTGIVPIVYGGTNYSRDAPPHSFINAEDYSSPEELAKYLNRLASNETEYNSYFEWQKSYAFFPHIFRRGFCKLCEIVNTPSFHKTYTNMKTWWSDGKCKKPTRV